MTRRPDVVAATGITVLVLCGAALSVWITESSSARPSSTEGRDAASTTTSRGGASTTTRSSSTTTSLSATGTSVAANSSTTVAGGVTSTTAVGGAVPGNPGDAPSTTTPVAAANGSIVAPRGGAWGAWRDGTTSDDEPGYYEDVVGRVDSNPSNWAVWLVRRTEDGEYYPEHRFAPGGTGQWGVTRLLFYESEEGVGASLLLVVTDPTLDSYYDQFLQSDIGTELVPEGAGQQLAIVAGACCRTYPPEDA